MTRRITALLICFLYLFTLVTACGTENKKPPVSETDPGEEAVLLDGNYIFYQLSTLTVSEDSPMFYIQGTDLADLALRRLSAIEDEFKCNITINYADSTKDYTGELNKSAAAGTPIADLVSAGNGSVIMSLLQSELLLPISQVNDIIQYDKDTFGIYGAPNLLEMAMYGGELYMITPYSHPARQLRSGHHVAFYDSYVKERTTLDLRELYEQGNWTWTAFEDCSSLCYDKTESYTVYGMVSTSGDFIGSAMLSNGFSRVKKENDEYVSALKSQNSIEAIDWIKMIYDRYKDIVVTQDRGTTIDTFAENGAAMLLTTAEYIRDRVAYSSSDFGIIPFPCGPRGNYKTNAPTSGFDGFGIFGYAEDADGAAHIIAAYCQPFEEYPDLPTALSYYDNMFYDSRDIQVMLNSDKYARCSYYEVGGNLLYTKIKENIDMMSASEILETFAPQMEDMIKEWIIPNSMLIDKLNEG